MILSDVLTCTVPPLRVESSILKNPIPPKSEKNNKHLAGCIAQERAFLPVVFTTLGGLGPPESVHYLDSLFSETYAAERAATGSTRRTNHLRTLFMQSLLASLTASTADMAAQLTHAAATDADADAAAAADAPTPAAPPG